MTYIVIGLGSMGKRRIRLLQENLVSLNLVGVDRNPDRLKEINKQFGIETFENIDQALQNREVKGALICTSPITHAQIILECLKRRLHVFTEINLINENYDELINTAKRNKVELFLSSTMLYRKEVQYIQERVMSSTKKICYRYHLGQYLPDWHPWENYKDFFVGDKRTNGCREILGIELPWIIETFGKVRSVQVMKDKVTDLDIDYDDTYMINIKHESGHQGVFIADVVCRKAMRNLEVFSEDMQLRWDGAPGVLEELDLLKKEFKSISMSEYFNDEKFTQENIVDATYFEELKVFHDKVNGKNNELYTFEKDRYTLSVIDEIEGV
ncbi:MAG: oxidoreductase [SAR324 cluster bacterium]|uniref:Oxidoreductase n=1 Tax=SAR324 cluster bacterium TaxID=2024889 RepID=A0A2A4T0S1_9DELT|nr:MAG: oxidoreductase [SAR324 cluster bacterium]